MNAKQVLALLLSQGVNSTGEQPKTMCDETITGPGAIYNGCQTETKYGKKCQPWPIEKCESCAGHSYCRNPDNATKKIWCYVDVVKGYSEDCNPIPATCVPPASITGVKNDSLPPNAPAGTAVTCDADNYSGSVILTCATQGAAYSTSDACTLNIPATNPVASPVASSEQDISQYSALTIGLSVTAAVVLIGGAVGAGYYFWHSPSHAKKQKKQ